MTLDPYTRAAERIIAAIERREWADNTMNAPTQTRDGMAAILRDAFPVPASAEEAARGAAEEIAAWAPPKGFYARTQKDFDKKALADWTAIILRHVATLLAAAASKPGPYQTCTDCGARMVWSDERAATPTWTCPACVLRRLAAAEASERALREAADRLVRDHTAHDVPACPFCTLRAALDAGKVEPPYDDSAGGNV